MTSSLGLNKTVSAIKTEVIGFPVYSDLFKHSIIIIVEAVVWDALLLYYIMPRDVCNISPHLLTESL